MCFQPTYLYIKQHTVTGLRYFGKTTKPDPHLYLGSGNYWKQHLKTHGNDVATVWISELFTSKDELIEFALFFSETFNIVHAVNKNNKKIWANQISENGIDGAPHGHIHTAKTKQKIGEANKGRHPSEETKAKMRAAHSGRIGIKGTIPWNKGITHSEATRKKISEARKNFPTVCCPHCNLAGKGNNMQRYHFDNCKGRK